jgi:hypothetical protein
MIDLGKWRHLVPLPLSKQRSALMAQAARRANATASVETASARSELTAAPEICHDLFEQTCVTFATTVSEWGTKIADAMTISTNNAFQFAGELAAARSWPDVIAAYTSQARKQFETMAAMTRDLTELNRKLATDVLTPITSGLPELLNTIAASRWR